MSGPFEQSQYQQQAYPSAQPYAQPYVQAPPMPPSNAGWAVVAVIFFWPLAISAFNHALKVHPLWLIGDIQGAEYSSKRAGFFGKLSLGIFFGFFLLYILFIALIVATS
ncbi:MULTISPECIES: CD225/dispanin family protein [unclassified Rhodococcus (in: high G+C Gram-positive bacteria)]|uniref:CD225/dispanin family protein n=1 Tax=unclassified Rhodococcus (in: high G+C Gram-positive bacteria) TaxID=192944 RepID=UPI0033940609